MTYFIIYCIVGMFLAYSLKHHLDIVKLIPQKADIKLRRRINQRKDRLELYIKLCPVWPVLLIKEIYDEIDEIQKRR